MIIRATLIAVRLAARINGRGVRLLAAACAAVMLAGSMAAHADAPPRRVVSMNLCTDQLAMLMADEDQLRSVSHLAIDPESSVLAEQARRFPINHGLAEEIFMMKPDLILSGTFTNRASIAMLKRLGFRLEEFPPSYSFPEIREQMLRMGRLLHREARAQELIGELDRQLAAIPEWIHGGVARLRLSIMPTAIRPARGRWRARSWSARVSRTWGPGWASPAWCGFRSRCS